MAQDIRLDLPNQSSWIYRAFAKRLDAPFKWTPNVHDGRI